MELLRVTNSLRNNPPCSPLESTCYCSSKSCLDVTCISLICKSSICVCVRDLYLYVFLCSGETSYSDNMRM
jgi:hypothetical protein